MVFQHPQRGKYSGYGGVQIPLSIWQLHEDYEETYLDPAMQRLGGYENGSGWTKSNTKSFLGSLLEGTNGAEVLRLRLDLAIRVVDDEGTLEYIRCLMNRGFKYVVIDGNNTSSAIYHFFKDFVAGAENPDKPNGKSKKYSQYNQADKDAIKMLPITVWEVSNITREEMTSLFRRLNKSTQLNKQENRQGRISLLAAGVRELANDKDANGEYRGGNTFWRNLYPGQKTDTRIHEEQVAKLGLKIEKNFGKSTNPTELDSMYEDDSDFGNNTKKRMKRVLNLAEKIAKARLNNKKAS